MTAYETVLVWCSIFLKNKSFTNQKGDHIAFSLLFPMEKIFEAYVAHYIRKHCNADKVALQDNKYYLVDKHRGKGKFKLKPDIVIEHDDEVIVADTKWKVINKNKPKDNYFISQGDMYQLFAYGKKYHAKLGSNDETKQKVSLLLIYPSTEDFKEVLDDFQYCDMSNGGMCLKVVPFDIKKSFEDNFDFCNSLLNKNH